MRVAPNLDHFVCISGIYVAIDLQSRFTSYEPHYGHTTCRFLKLGRRFSHVCPANSKACLCCRRRRSRQWSRVRPPVCGGGICRRVAGPHDQPHEQTGAGAPPGARLCVRCGRPCNGGGTFEAIESDLGSVDVLIYNAGKGVWGSAEEVTFEDFEAAWRTNTFGAFAAARSVITAMKRRAAGHIIFVGATASRRGGAKTAAFASAKAAQRSLAESLARSLGPSKIHVSLIIIDGIVDEPSIRTKLADKLDSFFVKPDDIADTALMLTRQKPSAWTFELEARPFGETW
jgi:hypothetical protein